MANRRMIYQDMFEDDEVGSLPIQVRLLWVGLISCVADDQGRLLDNASLIKSKVFAFDMDITNENTTEWINQLVKSRMLIRYKSGGKALLQIRSWWEYQTPSWAQASRFNVPTDWVDRIKVHTPNNTVKSVNWDQPGGLCSTLPTPVPTPVHSALNDIDIDIDIEGDIEGEPEEEKASGVFFEPLKLFKSITGMGAIPGTQLDKVLPALETLWYQHDKDADKLAAFLKPYFENWTKRKSKNGTFYSKANCSWLYDWAIAGEIPAESNSADAEKPRMRILRGADGETIEVPA